MSRLRKIAMDMNAFQGTINQTSNKGREILKSLEDFKFTLEQTARLLQNNQEMAQGMIQKRKAIDEITSKLYQIVFDIENTDISMAFQTQNQPVMEDIPTKSPVGEDSVEKPKDSNNPDMGDGNIQPPNITPPSNGPKDNSTEDSETEKEDDETDTDEEEE